MVDLVELPEFAEDAGVSYCGSDRNPVSVVANDGKLVEVVHDEWKVVEGSEQDGSAKYAYFANPEGQHEFFRLNAKGKYEHVYRGASGRWNKGYGSLSLGRRARYYDPHF
jgi:hypothetical protein